MKIIRRCRNITTPQLESILHNHLKKMGTYICREVSMPTECRCQKVKERVDMCSCDTKGIWRFYELKITVSDFHSKNHNTFCGNFNYYVFAPGMYEKVAKEIPANVGVIEVYPNTLQMYCAKPARFQDLQVDVHDLHFNFMQALSREYNKVQKDRLDALYDSWYERG